MLKINKDIQIGDTGRTLEMLGETVAETLPVGTIAPYGGSTSQVPQNWLPCDGREVSRLEYAKLFSIIGTRFGVGDGSTTFNLPNLQGKIPVGQDANDSAFDVIGETGGEKTHTLTVNEMPSHHHNLGFDGITNLVDPGQQGKVGAPDTVVSSWVTTNTGGGQAHNNLQPYQVTLYIIKAFDQQLGNLRSESLPVGSEIDFDGTVSQIPEGWEQITNPESYSTNEIKTNKTWIDGKPIYRKVYSGNIANGATLFTNVDAIINISGYGFLGDLSRKVILNGLAADTPTTLFSCFYGLNNTIEFYAKYGGNATTAYNSNIILEYTKTTD